MTTMPSLTTQPSPVQIRTNGEFLNHNAFADAGVFINDRAFNLAILPDLHRGGLCLRGFRPLIVIIPHQYTIDDCRSAADLAAQPNNRMGNLRLFDPAAFSQQNIL